MNHTAELRALKERVAELEAKLEAPETDPTRDPSLPEGFNRHLNMVYDNTGQRHPELEEGYVAPTRPGVQSLADELAEWELMLAVLKGEREPPPGLELSYTYKLDTNESTPCFAKRVPENGGNHRYETVTLITDPVHGVEFWDREEIAAGRKWRNSPLREERSFTEMQRENRRRIGRPIDEDFYGARGEPTVIP